VRPWYLKPFKVLDAVPGGTSVNSDPTNVLFGTFVNYIVSWAGVTGTGSVQIQTTNDDVKNPNVVPLWVNEGSPVSVTGSSGSGVIKITNPAGMYVRAQYTFGTVSTGTVTVSIIGRQS
jgi:hypothetical protein